VQREVKTCHALVGRIKEFEKKILSFPPKKMDSIPDPTQDKFQYNNNLAPVYWHDIGTDDWDFFHRHLEQYIFRFFRLIRSKQPLHLGSIVVWQLEGLSVEEFCLLLTKIYGKEHRLKLHQFPFRKI